MKEPSTHFLIISNLRAQVDQLQKTIDQQQFELQELANMVDRMQKEHSELVNEYIDLREEYNILQSKGKEQ